MSAYKTSAPANNSKGAAYVCHSPSNAMAEDELDGMPVPPDAYEDGVALAADELEAVSHCNSLEDRGDAGTADILLDVEVEFE
jgi:hypothetical protein